MRKLLTGIMVAESLALSTPAALADSLENLTEVEVSLWEIVAATMFSRVDSEANGEILGGRIPDTNAIDEYKKRPLHNSGFHLGQDFGIPGQSNSGCLDGPVFT